MARFLPLKVAFIIRINLTGVTLEGRYVSDSPKRSPADGEPFPVATPNSANGALGTEGGSVAGNVPSIFNREEAEVW